MVTAAVKVRLEHRALFGDFPKLGKRHHLKPAGIGQNRTRPVHKFMQSAQSGHPLCTGTQHQMVGIAEHDLRAGFCKLFRKNALNCAHRADRHKGRCINNTVRRRDLSAPRRAVFF